jgi:hypothetical protein
MASIIASQSLTNMSVASDQSPPNGALLMPKLSFRFRVSFVNFGVDADTTVLTRQIVDVTRPNVSFADITLPVYNSTVKLAGKHTWADITINLRDDAAGTVSKLVGQQLQKQLDFVEQASAASGQNYKFVTFIEVLDGGNGATAPTVLETWECLGCYVKTANYNTLTYADNNPVTIQLAIAYDNAVQSPLASGVGTAVGQGIARSNPTGVSTGTGTGAPG